MLVTVEAATYAKNDWPFIDNFLQMIWLILIFLM